MEIIAGYAIVTALAIWIIGTVIETMKVWVPRILIGVAVCVIAIVAIDKVSDRHVVRTIVHKVESIPEPKPILHTTVNAYRVNTKPGVNIKQLHPDMDAAIVKIVDAYQGVLGKGYVPTITSGNDSDAHKKRSAHYRGAALDFRLKDIDGRIKRREVVYAVRASLGSRFFVDHEFIGGTNEHLHVQLR